jgi:hypothetical protein
MIINLIRRFTQARRASRPFCQTLMVVRNPRFKASPKYFTIYKANDHGNQDNACGN